MARTEGLLESVVNETNLRLPKREPTLVRQQKALQRSLDEVNAQAGNLLTEWSTLAGGDGRAFVTEKLQELAQRLANLERGLEEVGHRLAQVHQVYECLKPYEQRELMQLVVHRAQVTVRELTLEINEAVCPAIAPASVDLGAVVRETQIWLLGLVSQSVLRQRFPVRLASLLKWSRCKRQTIQEVAESWQGLLESGVAANRAAVARLQGVSRARVTQVLGALTPQGAS